MADVLPAELVVMYQDAFFYFDTDKDGVITTKQLGPLLRQCGENPTEADIQVSISDEIPLSHKTVQNYGSFKGFSVLVLDIKALGNVCNKI